MRKLIYRFTVCVYFFEGGIDFRVLTMCGDFDKTKMKIKLPMDAKVGKRLLWMDKPMAYARL